MIGLWFRVILVALIIGLFGSAVTADEITIAVTLADTDIHQDADASSPVFARVPSAMRLVVKGRIPGWIKISGPGRHDAWIPENAVRIESRSIEKGPEKAVTSSADSQKPSDSTAESWSVNPGNDPMSSLNARVDKLEQRVRELEERISTR